MDLQMFMSHIPAGDLTGSPTTRQPQETGRLTPEELAVLMSVWPAGLHHRGPVADVFTASGARGWLLIAKRSHHEYVLVEDGGRRSQLGDSLASLGLPDQPLCINGKPHRGRASGARQAGATSGRSLGADGPGNIAL
jgi:hypothetical protein